MRVLFVSMRHLFPLDSGGKIRTRHILKGLRERGHSIRVVCPAASDGGRWQAEMQEVCDDFACWTPQPGRFDQGLWRIRHALDRLPIPIRTGVDAAARACVDAELARPGIDVVVFDFLHSAVLRPSRASHPSVLFTHNVEAEIIARQAGLAPLATRWFWQSQARKLRDFERDEARRFGAVVAVSERDRVTFERDYGAAQVVAIPTSVDVGQMPFRAETTSTTIGFCGSMDWTANQDGVGWFLDEVWPRVLAARPDADLCIIGRAPPAALVARGERERFRCTGYVDEVVSHLHRCALSIIPLRIGGGTRIKAFESMALGLPIVSTALGMEGLDVVAGEHFLCADDPAAFAQAVVGLLDDPASRHRMARAARALVEERFSYRMAAGAFERALDLAVARGTAAP